MMQRNSNSHVARTSDGLPLRYAGEFGFSLLACLLLEMGLLLLMAGRFNGPPSFYSALPLMVGFGSVLLVALILRFVFGLAGVLAGALTATAIIVLFALTLFFLVSRSVQGPVVSFVLEFMG